ncbi:MAG: MarR family winged helix-turn-helix transcriptional regulator [Acidimicrobiales bacterium]
MPDRDEHARQAWSTVTSLFMSDEQHDRLIAACDEVGLPHPGTLKVLTWLDPLYPPSMREISGWMNCDASWITNIVDALEELGYVERRVSPTDRRVKLVAVTEAGGAAKDRALAIIQTPPKAFDRLTDREVATLARLCQKLEGSLPRQ